MNFFCTIFGHTWVHKSETPKTSWNVDKDGLLLFAHPAGDVLLYEECARCKQRRNERRIEVETKGRPSVPSDEAEADEEATAAAS